MRIEQGDGWTLYNGDCLDVLPTLTGVDAVVTDPPYGIDFKYATHDDDPAKYETFMRAFIQEAQRLVGDGPVFVWQSMLNADRWHRWFPPGFRLFAACKGFVQYRPVPVQYSWDPVVFWGRPKVAPSVYNKDFHVNNKAPFGAGRPKIDHPCPRSLEQVEYVVQTYTLPDDIVLDPFMGSGTTGVACLQTGRRFIGIEIDPGYFDVAVRRIEAAAMQQRLDLAEG